MNWSSRSTPCHRTIQSDTFDRSTPLPTHPFPVLVYFRVDTMEGGDHQGHNFVLYQHITRTFSFRRWWYVLRESFRPAKLLRKGGPPLGRRRYQCNALCHRKGRDWTFRLRTVGRQTFRRRKFCQTYVSPMDISSNGRAVEQPCHRTGV